MPPVAVVSLTIGNPASSNMRRTIARTEGLAVVHGVYSSSMMHVMWQICVW